MGIFSSLLTGGILVGKICQALSGSQSTRLFSDKETGATVAGPVTAGGVTFFRSNVSGKSMLYAYNPSTDLHAEVAVPNDANSAGVQYVIAPTEKIPFAEADSPQVPPTTNITTGLSEGSTMLSPQNPGINSLFRLAFSGLKIGNWVNIGSFKLTCTTSQLIIVSASIVATAITYMFFHSDKGVSATSLASILPEPPTGAKLKGATEQHFAVAFADLGFNMANDTLDGQVTLGMGATGKELMKLSKLPSEPLHPTESKFFALLAKGKL